MWGDAREVRPTESNRHKRHEDLHGTRESFLYSHAICQKTLGVNHKQQKSACELTGIRFLKLRKSSMNSFRSSVAGVAVSGGGIVAFISGGIGAVSSKALSGRSATIVAASSLWISRVISSISA